MLKFAFSRSDFWFLFQVQFVKTKENSTIEQQKCKGHEKVEFNLHISQRNKKITFWSSFLKLVNLILKNFNHKLCKNWKSVYFFLRNSKVEFRKKIQFCSFYLLHWLFSKCFLAVSLTMSTFLVFRSFSFPSTWRLKQLFFSFNLKYFLFFQPEVLSCVCKKTERLQWVLPLSLLSKYAYQVLTWNMNLKRLRMLSNALCVLRRS